MITDGAAALFKQAFSSSSVHIREIRGEKIFSQASGVRNQESVIATRNIQSSSPMGSWNIPPMVTLCCLIWILKIFEPRSTRSTRSTRKIEILPQIQNLEVSEEFAPPMGGQRRD